jgi:hypothetical protein
MKSKVNVKSSYSIKKVKRVMRMKDEGFEPTTYEVWKVSKNDFTKYFVSRKDAEQFVFNYTTMGFKISPADLYKEIKRLENMKLPIKTI